MGERIKIVLACVACDARNFRTTKRTDSPGQVGRSKFCPACKQHTLHRETK